MVLSAVTWNVLSPLVDGCLPIKLVLSSGTFCLIEWIAHHSFLLYESRLDRDKEIQEAFEFSLVLKNGVEVKLQRNALSVLEHPTRDEADDDHDFDNSSSGSDIASSIEFYRPAKPRVRHTKPWVQSASLKATNRSSYRDVQSIIRAPQSVNMARLDTDSLRRYCRHFKLVGTTNFDHNDFSSTEKLTFI